MNRVWIHGSRLSDEYENEVTEFLEFAKRNAPASSGNKYYCPCVKCLNGRRHEVEVIREHLICDEFIQSYTSWMWHGELLELSACDSQSVPVDVGMDERMDDRMEDMIRQVGEESFRQSHVYSTLESDAETPLYPGCIKFTRLSAVLKLVNVKARNRWSDKSFTKLLKEMPPEDNSFSNRNYEAKKVFCPMGMEYKKAHAFPNDCILYKNEFEGLHKCPKCGVSRYKIEDDDSTSEDIIEKGLPVKVL